MLIKNKKISSALIRKYRPHLFVLSSGLIIAASAITTSGNQASNQPANPASPGTSVAAGPSNKKKSTQNTANPTPETPPTPAKNPSAGGATTSSTLIDPYGTYASDHEPSSKNQTEQSICKTSPGATCRIDFTMNGTTRSLPSATTNSNGTVSWVWTAQQYGLTTGSWKITMVASLNGKSKTSSDVILLKVP